MLLPQQAEGVERTTASALVLPVVSAAGAGGVSPQLRVGPVGPGFPEDPYCYHRCRGNGVDDLTCRFFCDLRPFTIGGALIAA